jgi:hypothetical protein
MSEQDWIPVSERDAPSKATVLVAARGGDNFDLIYLNQDASHEDAIGIGIATRYRRQWLEFYTNEVLHNVTHWMPLPRPPST